MTLLAHLQKGLPIKDLLYLTNVTKKPEWLVSLILVMRAKYVE